MMDFEKQNYLSYNIFSYKAGIPIEKTYWIDSTKIFLTSFYSTQKNLHFFHFKNYNFLNYWQFSFVIKYKIIHG